MKASVAVYNSHDDAVQALNLLTDQNFPLDKVSILGKAEVEDDKIHIRSNTPLIASPLIAGTALGTTFGLLTGIGVLAIPGLGFLFGAGAIVGLFGGFEAGALIGGVGSFLLSIGIKEDYVVKYEEHLKNGKFLIFINGTDAEIEKAKWILHEHAEHHQTH